MVLKLRLALGFLTLTLLFPALAETSGLAEARGRAGSSPTVLVLQDGTRLDVQSYSVKGQIVVFESAQGKLQSVPAAMVDFEAMDKVGRNGPSHANGPAGEITSEAAATGADGVGSDEPRPASAMAGTKEELANGRTSETPPRRQRSNPPPAFQVGDDEDPTAGAAPAPTGALTGEGPAPPEAPEVIVRDAEGRVSVRATRISEPLNVDGKLEEGLYRTVPSMGDFIQQEPHEGQPATEKTEVWVFFDKDNVYVAARCWDTQPDRIIANEMRRDNRNLSNNSNFAVILDTFYDRRNGYLFYTNPLGGLYDAQVTDERNTNSDWNTVWQVKTGRFAQGWTVEMEIPFKSLRYKPGASQVWGVNFRRIVRWKNETSHLTPISAAFRRNGLLKLSQSATLVGIEPPARTLNLEVKPYATGGVRTDLTVDDPYENDLDGDVGFDAKYGVTRSMTFDFTYNTDFAQVENDDQQVNLTRFSLFFPEKREFFLEGQGIFNFGGRSTRRSGGGGGGSDMPILFYSRRIGFQDSASVPINLGGRLTGRAGKYSVGALAMQTRDAIGEESLVPPTNFGVMRFKRDVLGRSNIGVIGTYRSNSLDDLGSNSVFGVDGNFTFLQNLNINTYWARSWTPGLMGEDQSYMGKLDYGGDKYGLTLEHMNVGGNFNPELGFLRRDDMIKNRGQVRFSPRPRSIKAVRRFTFEGSFNYITDTDWFLETRTESFEFRTEFESGDFARFEYTRFYDFLPEEWEISDGIFLPIGGYNFQDFSYMYRFGPQRRVSGMVDFNHGSFYGGNRKSVGLWGRAEITKQFSVSPRVSQNWVNLTQGDFTTTLVSVRADYTFSPRAFLGALLQYNASDNYFGSNIRFRWEYRPGSDIYVVYSDGRDTFYGGYPRLENRSLVVKVTRLFRF